MTSAIAGPARSAAAPGPGRAGASRGIGPQPWLAHLETHLPVARAGEDPEGVHQVRVACARLLVWLQMGGWRVLQDDLRWLRRHAARMRDLDVLRTEDGPALLPERTELAAARRELEQALGVVCDHAAALRRLERGSGAAGEGPRAKLAQSLRQSRSVARRAWRKARPLLKRLA